MVENPCMNLTVPKLHESLGICEGLFPGHPVTTTDMDTEIQSMDAQVPYVKWCRSVYAFGPPHLHTPSFRPKTVWVFIGKKIICKWTCGHVQFKPMVFKDYLNTTLYLLSYNIYMNYALILKLKE